MLIAAFSSASGNVENFDWVGAYRLSTPDAGQDFKEQFSILRSCVEQLELTRPGEPDEALGRTMTARGSRIFIGHGGASAWREVKDLSVVDRLKPSRLRASSTSASRRRNTHCGPSEADARMTSAFALIIMTAEDEHGDGKQHATENVVRRGRVVPRSAGIPSCDYSLEQGCEEFSNIEG